MTYSTQLKFSSGCHHHQRGYACAGHDAQRCRGEARQAAGRRRLARARDEGFWRHLGSRQHQPLRQEEKEKEGSCRPGYGGEKPRQPRESQESRESRELRGRAPRASHVSSRPRPSCRRQRDNRQRQQNSPQKVEGGSSSADRSKIAVKRRLRPRNQRQDNRPWRQRQR